MAGINKAMTIGIEATKAYEKEKTGVGWYCYYIVKGIAEIIDGDVELCLYVNPDAQISKSKFLISKQIPTQKAFWVKLQIPNNQQYNNITVKQLSWFPKKFWTLGRLSIEMLINPPDVLFIPAHLPPLMHPKRLVVTIHDLAFKQYPEVYSARERMLQEWGIRRVLKRAWRIIVPSGFTKSEIYKYYPRLAKDNIFVVPHGIEHEVFKNQNENLKCKSILYIGRLESKKNIVNLIRAFDILKAYKLQATSYKLILIGSPGFGCEAIKKEIMASPYKSDIIQTGWLDRKQTVEHLANATAFIFPSLYEGFGMPLLEAFACGAPVLCSNIPALQEVGRDIPLYVNPHDPQDIAEKMRTLLENPELQKQKSAEGLVRAREFTWKKAAEETLEVMTVNI